MLMKFNNLNTFDFSFAVPIVYNKIAFERTLINLRSGFDILSNNDISLILESNEFMRRKTFYILFNKYSSFKKEYIDTFYMTIVGSN